MVNPILRGFHPDPCAVRVGEDYYLVNSTFFWWPGVMLYHSRDLIHWEQLPHPLNRISQLDLRGVSAAGGVWAPDLTYADGVFYLIYTNVRSMYTCMYDTANYLVTASDPRGPWSDPVPLPGFGFDPSLFHDDDGRKYLISMVTDHRVPKKYAGRLIIQELSGTAAGQPHEVYCGDEIYLEGPHLLKHDGRYYIFAADTGTGEGHGQSLLRADSIFGPYEMYRPSDLTRLGEHDAWSVLTTRYDPDFPIQKCGHCSLVDTPEGKLYALHLCGRPSGYRNPEGLPRFGGERRYPLGRETAIQEMEWTKDGWLRLKNHTNHPELEVPGIQTGAPAEGKDDFDEPVLRLLYQSPYIPQDERHLSLAARPGWLRMYGRDGIASRYDQTMIARRWTEMSFRTGCAVDFAPENFKQLAGLVLLYDLDNFLYLHITRDEELGRCAAILQSVNRVCSYPAGFVQLPEEGTVQLMAAVKECVVQFSYRISGGAWIPIGPAIRGDFMSDEACMDGWFSGSVAGICCQDLTGSGKYADFDWFYYDPASDPLDQKLSAEILKNSTNF